MFGDPNDFAPRPTGSPAGGGGFLDSPGSQRTARKSDQQTLIPVTIRQLWNSEQGSDEMFRVDQCPLAQITFVGKVIHVEDQHQSNVNYKIDDGTGIIDVRVWLTADDAGAPSREEVMPHNVYVRVFGHLRMWQQSLNVIAFRMVRLSNTNEFTYHMLDAIHTHLYNTKGPLPATPAGGAAAAPTPSQLPVPTFPAGPVASLPTPQNPTGFTDFQQAILQYLSTAPNAEVGRHLTEVTSALQHRYPSDMIQRELEELRRDSHVYNTLDDFHFSTNVAV